MKSKIGCLFFLGYLLCATCLFAGSPQKPLYNSSLDGWRFGIGCGTALYLGDQMDYALTLHYGDFRELQLNIQLGASKQINQEREWGLAYKHGALLTLKSSNTQGIECHFDEFQMAFNYSLNENVGLNAGRFTCNLLYGFGATYFKSRYFTVNRVTKSIDYLRSSIGYNLESGKDRYGNDVENIADKKIAFLGTIGLNLGFVVARNVILYVENSLQATISNKLSGNLFKKSVIPPDGYFYSGVSIYYRFGGGASRLGCPKLWYR